MTLPDPPTPLGALRVFAAAARHENFKRAAEMLGVTPTAVSAQVKSLEAFLGRRLFERGPRQVRLTPAGRKLAASCEEAFARLERDLAELKAEGRGPLVTIDVGPVFAAQWLAKRLDSFWERFPATGLHLRHSPGTVDFTKSNADMMIAWGDGAWPGLESEPLMAVRATPVASPAFLRRRPTAPSLESLLEAPLLHWKDHAGWREWLETLGLPPGRALSGAVIEDANVVLQAALSGQGIALGLLPLVEAELQRGALVRLFTDEITPSRAYHLVYREDALRQDSLKAFRDWILGEAAAKVRSR